MKCKCSFGISLPSLLVLSICSMLGRIDFQLVVNDWQPPFLSRPIDSTPCLSGMGFGRESGIISRSYFGIIKVLLSCNHVRTAWGTISYSLLKESHLRKWWCGILRVIKTLWIKYLWNKNMKIDKNIKLQVCWWRW